LHYAAAQPGSAYNFQRLCENLRVTFVTGHQFGSPVTSERRSESREGCYYAPKQMCAALVPNRALGAKKAGSAAWQSRIGCVR
jgi:hypothetical protein